jgi:hypothetical protein
VAAAAVCPEVVISRVKPAVTTELAVVVAVPAIPQVRAVLVKAALVAWFTLLFNSVILSIYEFIRFKFNR